MSTPLDEMDLSILVYQEGGKAGGGIGCFYDLKVKNVERLCIALRQALKPNRAHWKHWAMS